MGLVTSDDPREEVVALLEAAMHRGPPTEVTGQAPVLFVPRVVDAALRDRLIRLLEQQGSVETGVETSSGGARARCSTPATRDAATTPSVTPTCCASCRRRSGVASCRRFARRSRSGPPVSRVSRSPATTRPTGGFFRPHRDNLSPSTAHRVFALTINLNDVYEGGQLRFPEYGNQLYRPDSGAALVFSCAHLHEVLDVTAGRRFALLSFLYGEPAADAAQRGTLP